MIDIVNVQLYGFPVLMYAMILVTTGAITYATVYADKMPSVGPLPGFPSANPSASNLTNGIPGMPNAPPPPPPPPPSQPGPQGGKNKSKRKTHKKRVSFSLRKK